MNITSTISNTRKEDSSMTLSNITPTEISHLYEMITSAPLPQRREFDYLKTYIKKNFIDTNML